MTRWESSAPPCFGVFVVNLNLVAVEGRAALQLHCPEDGSTELAEVRATRRGTSLTGGPPVLREQTHNDHLP